MRESSNFISVVIPTHNREIILKRCLEAFGNQSCPKELYEIVVVDDGSTDGTRELLDDFSKKMANLRYFSQPSGGPAKARNLGIEKARGPIILFTGDDCIPHERLLQEHLRLYKKGEAIAVLGHIDWHPGLEVTPFMRYITIDTQFSYPKIKELARDVPFCYFYTSNISVAKKDIERAGEFDEEFKEAVFEDVELGYRLWKSGVRIVYNPRALTYHLHRVELANYIERQVRLGKAAAILYRKHPELLTFLRVPRVTSPEVRYRLYQALLDYHYFAGLQGGLEAVRDTDGSVPLDDRLKNWSDIEKDRLTKTVQRLEDLIISRDSHILKQDRQILSQDRELRRRDELIRTLNEKNQEKYYRIVELEKFELHVKSSFVFKAFGALRSILRRKSL